jgi:hypothetical protein
VFQPIGTPLSEAAFFKIKKIETSIVTLKKYSESYKRQKMQGINPLCSAESHFLGKNFVETCKEHF